MNTIRDIESLKNGGAFKNEKSYSKLVQYAFETGNTPSFKKFVDFVK